MQDAPSNTEPESVSFNSTNVDSATWYPTTGTLEVTFMRDGSTYTYTNVPRNVWEDMQRTHSVGRFVNQTLRGVYGQ
jgi:hypothetical protein